MRMVYSHFYGAGRGREMGARLRSPASKLYHLGGCPVSRSALSTANASRPAEVFGGLLLALVAQVQRGYRRKIGECVRLIVSTSVRLNSLSGNSASFSTGIFDA